MILAYAPALVALLGALVYALAANAKAQELGRIAYAAGLLVSLLVLGTRLVVRL